ncbi:MAG: ATP-binding protein [Anaerolineae bacterium]
MDYKPRHGFRTAELDPDILSTPFRVQTNWHVMTGAPCSGKTTLIKQLANEGFQTAPEAARVYIASEMAQGRTIAEILENVPARQRGIVNAQVRTEGGLRPLDVVFLDRGVPDSLAFNRAYGLDPNDILLDCLHHRYASVFLLDPLPFRGDGARDGDAAEIGYLDEWIARDYTALGYQVVRVPAVSPQERLAFVLQTLSEQGLI